LVNKFAFIGCIGLTNVIIQPGISGIEHRAFKGCRSLRRLSLPGTLREIRDSAFLECIALTNIIFPASLRGLGLACFQNCTALKTAYFLGDRPAADYNAFSGANLVTLFHFPGARDWIPVLGGAPTAVGFPPGSEPRRATAYPTFLTGFVVSATVVDPGRGYISAPQVAIVGGGGTGALATATVSDGSVTAVTIVNPGKGYTNEPTVVIGAPPISGPPARAFGISQVVNGFVVGVSLAEAGSGYTFAPAVKLLGGAGSGAVAEAVLDSSGMLSYVRVTNAGKGYSSEPQVVIEPPVVPDLRQEVTAAQSVVFRNLNSAKSYELYRIMDGQLSRSGIVVGPNKTSYAGTVDGGEPARLMELPAAIRARAAPTVINGFLVGVNLLDGGSRYAQAPAIRVLDSTGSGAMLVAKVSLGSVSSISVENPGSNYSQNARIEIDEPTPILVAPEVQPLLKLTVENLLPYFGYQLEAAENLPQFGALEASFVANSNLRVFYQPMSTKERFFRLRYLR
jgi:hypothetical protein